MYSMYYNVRFEQPWIKYASVRFSPMEKRQSDLHAAQIWPSVFWQAEYSSSYLDEMIWHNGHGNVRHVELLGDCPDCGGGKKRKQQEDVDGMNAMYRCTVCVLGELTCGWCMQRRHSRMPFHRIEVSTVQ